MGENWPVWKREPVGTPPGGLGGDRTAETISCWFVVMPKAHGVNPLPDILPNWGSHGHTFEMGYQG